MSDTIEQQNVDSSSLRRAMGRFGTGIAVIAARQNDTIHGMTANSVTTVSFEPLLVMFCVSKKSRMNEFVRQAGSFSINILASYQEQISRHFAGNNPEQNKAPYGLHFAEIAGVPVLKGAISNVVCHIHQVIEAGDHDIVLGKVEAVRYEEEEHAPLLYYRGHYRYLETPATLTPRPREAEWIDSGKRIYYEEW
jgi:flavin reductase (DIM6/NTAB) family NADH-FMN oxidoreductase RutF